MQPTRDRPPQLARQIKMRKCDLCVERLKAGLKQACVKACPFGALRWENPNQAQNDKERRWLDSITAGSQAQKS